MWQADRQLRGLIPSEDSSAGRQRRGSPILRRNYLSVLSLRSGNEWPSMACERALPYMQNRWTRPNGKSSAGYSLRSAQPLRHRPVCRKDFSLLKYSDSSLFLHVWRIAVFSEDALYQDFGEQDYVAGRDTWVYTFPRKRVPVPIPMQPSSSSTRRTR